MSRDDSRVQDAAKLFSTRKQKAETELFRRIKLKKQSKEESITNVIKDVLTKRLRGKGEEFFISSVFVSPRTVCEMCIPFCKTILVLL